MKIVRKSFFERFFWRINQLSISSGKRDMSICFLQTKSRNDSESKQMEKTIFGRFFWRIKLSISSESEIWMGRLRVKMNGNYLKDNFWALLLTYKSTLYLFREARFEHLKFLYKQKLTSNLGKTDSVKMNGK